MGRRSRQIALDGFAIEQIAAEIDDVYRKLQLAVPPGCTPVGTGNCLTYNDAREGAFNPYR